MPSSGVGDDVERDEQAVVALYHRASPAGGHRCRVDGVSDVAARSARGENRSACARMRPRSKRPCPRARGDARRRRRPASGSSTSTPVSPSTTVSSAPPRASATTGRPQACASSGHDAEVLFAGQEHGRGARDTARASSSSDARPRNSHVGAGQRARARRALGPVADDRQRHAGTAARVDREVDAFVGHERGHDEQRRRSGAAAVGVIELGVDGRIHDGRLAIIVSARSCRATY